MSEHTDGKLIAKYEWLVPEAHQDRPIGNSSNPIHDRDNYAHVVAQVRGRYHNQDANARRLAAAWNLCEGIDTESLETGATLVDICERSNGYQFELSAANARIAKLEALVAERDAMLGKRPCQNSRCNELNAYRALLREVMEGTEAFSNALECNYDFNGIEWSEKARDYLDAYDTLEGK